MKHYTPSCGSSCSGRCQRSGAHFDTADPVIGSGFFCTPDTQKKSCASPQLTASTASSRSASVVHATSEVQEQRHRERRSLQLPNNNGDTEISHPLECGVEELEKQKDALKGELARIRANQGHILAAACKRPARHVLETEREQQKAIILCSAREQRQPALAEERENMRQQRQQVRWQAALSETQRTVSQLFTQDADKIQRQKHAAYQEMLRARTEANTCLLQGIMVHDYYSDVSSFDFRIFDCLRAESLYPTF